MYARDHALIATPVGPILIEGEDAALSRIRIGVDAVAAKGTSAAVRSGAEQLEQWFAGEREAFDLVLLPATTDRGDALRQGLIAVAYGATLSYGALARQLCSSARAIGQLCARNPFPIIVPCHRVLGDGGKLGAYSAGDGPKTKFWLLEHERRHAKGTLL